MAITQLQLLRSIRAYVYIASGVVAAMIWAVVWLTVPASSSQTIQLAEGFAFGAVILLYITLIISPLYLALPWLPYRAVVVKARQATGVSAFGFALVHASLTFFLLLGGFSGLAFLSQTYLVAIALSATALTILAILAVTSHPHLVKRLGKRWKLIHQLVYIAAVLVVIHALLLGSNFSDLSGIVPQISLVLVAILLLLEANRIDQWLRRKSLQLPKLGPAFAVGLMIVGVVATLLYAPSGAATGLSIHAAHIQLAQQAQQNVQTSSIPGLTGDRSLRYSVNFTHPDQISANQPTDLHFSVEDASNGSPSKIFETIYTKTSHLVIVDSQLEYFSHIHPDLNSDTFSITTQFPHDGVYHLYLDFQPFGAIEQQFGFSLRVGTGTDVTPATQKPGSLTEVTDGHEVSLSLPGTLHAQSLSLGQQLLTFMLKDAATKAPLTNLKTYLGAFGHLVMINETTYDYLHVHPNVLAPSADATGGPQVVFLPLGIYGPIKPGIYRVFVQFNPDDQLFTSDFTVEVKQ